MKETKYIDLDLDKWLREKGFDKWLDIYSEKNHMLSGWLENDLYIDEVELPIELINSLIVEWLRIDHGIWIYCKYQKRGKISFLIEDLQGNNITISPDLNSPQEAYSAAFDYIKNKNLI